MIAALNSAQRIEMKQIKKKEKEWNRTLTAQLNSLTADLQFYKMYI